MDVRATNPGLFASGMVADYDVVVTNQGTKPPAPVQVLIEATGSVQFQAMDQTPAGFTCEGTGPVTCLGEFGGNTDAVQTRTVTFTVRLYGAKTGLGALTVTADPNNLIQESDKTDDVGQKTFNLS